MVEDVSVLRYSGEKAKITNEFSAADAMTQPDPPDQAGTVLETRPISCAEFLAKVPPGTARIVTVEFGTRAVMKVCGVGGEPPSFPDSGANWRLPRIQIYCDHRDCGGVRYFEPEQDDSWTPSGESSWKYLRYMCGNCKEGTKLYAVGLTPKDWRTAEIVKLGEFPPFGPPLSSRLLRFVGEGAGLLKRGYRSEKDGLGIGAFGYYRRVLDQQRVRIFDRLIEISRVLGAEEVVDDLKRARKETQFKLAIDTIKKSLPQALYIEGHNPLTLLHSALSEGLHELSDDKCLEMAADVRLVLTELAERLDQLSKDDKKLKAAVGRLSQKQTPK